MAYIHTKAKEKEYKLKSCGIKKNITYLRVMFLPKVGSLFALRRELVINATITHILAKGGFYRLKTHRNGRQIVV